MENLQTVAKVALLIDADNVSDRTADDLFRKAASSGHLIVRRAYGVMAYDKKTFPWGKEPLHRYAIESVARPQYVSGKNITDMTLVIDAMDLAHRKVVNVVCIASNDSDFSPLAMKLREYGITVYGFGGKQAQESFIKSCDVFNRIFPKLEEDDLAKHLQAACAHYGDADGWVLMATVGEYLKRVDPGFSPQNYGHEKLKQLLEGMDGFEVGETKYASGDSHPKIRIADAPEKKK